jgi:hypothetical protein
MMLHFNLSAENILIIVQGHAMDFYPPVLGFTA